ncbi:unnamed protein product [Kluyveromyces dobzhanskii CBS 2104]|uniref:WGS project CCBQ000000000 data, contig 00097 n=1 Tax=Kluyveromyces dobzhanskii CBS 2104 TaxID=1427455 RepID=A0A0A8L2K8_9SACH|nr:unnamed protein product [Kluyveromyces dobzhanskii CBS 2104]
MSNQSGITADQEVLNAVADLQVHHASVVGKIVQSDEPVIQLHDTFKDLNELKQFIEGNEDTPYYVIIHEEPKRIFVSYTPDCAPIRSKMLYASSKIAFQRQIGANNLKSFMFTEPSDIDEKSWTDSTAKEELMTRSELEKLQIDAQQNSMRSAGAVQLVSAQAGNANTLGFKVVDAGNLRALFEKYNLLVFTIDLSKEEIVIKNKINTSCDGELIERISSDSPTYSILHKSDDYYFILSCPSGSSIKERMVYAANKRAFQINLKDSDNIQIKRTFEIGDSDELDLSELTSEDHESAVRVAAKPKFNKPKAPSRRR